MTGTCASVVVAQDCSSGARWMAVSVVRRAVRLLSGHCYVVYDRMSSYDGLVWPWRRGVSFEISGEPRLTRSSRRPQCRATFGC